jgi:hypothetical protein
LPRHHRLCGGAKVGDWVEAHVDAQGRWPAGLSNCYLICNGERSCMPRPCSAERRQPVEPKVKLVLTAFLPPALGYFRALFRR